MRSDKTQSVRSNSEVPNGGWKNPEFLFFKCNYLKQLCIINKEIYHRKSMGKTNYFGFFIEYNTR